MRRAAAFGGKLNNVGGTNQFAYGGLFPQTITSYDVGGTHEENPLSGIPMGIGENGNITYICIN
jgi:hypothetical protein